VNAPHLSSHGYVRVRLPDGSRTYEHKIVAERALGRALKTDETVHHIDGDKTNNSPKNLLICKRAYHVELHTRLEASPDWPQFQPHNKVPNGQSRAKGKSGFKGVEFDGFRWIAAASMNRKKTFIGRHNTAEDAARAYDDFVIAHRGPNWATNKSLGLL